MKSFALASGSSGNCFYVQSSSGKKILVDIGLSFRRTREILLSRGINIEDIDYVFITHEHSDHCQGLQSFVKNVSSTKVFLSKGTYRALGFEIENKQIVKNHEVLVLEDFKVFVIEKSHDSSEALSYVFENGLKLGIFTDLGYVSDEIKHVLKTLDVIYFEGSYCEDIVKQRELRYNYVNRLVSDVGHLSIKESAKVLSEIANNSQRIILSHISTNANTYENAYLYVKNFLKGLGIEPQLSVSFQDEPTDWV